jgi:hypothetical protein
MLFNVIKLKEGVTVDDAEIKMGEMCNIIKNTYDGFLAGQVFKYSGFISKEGTVGSTDSEGEHLAIVTYWTSFAEHEKSHADELFLEKFSELAELCSETKELGYELLWQGAAEESHYKALRAI